MNDSPSPDVCLKIHCPEPREAVWNRLLGPQGLCARGELADTAMGASFAIETAAGDLFEGSVVSFEPGVELVLGIANMHGSELHIGLEDTGDPEAPTALEFSLLVVGLHHDEVESFRLRWRMQLADLFRCNLETDVGWLH